MTPTRLLLSLLAALGVAAGAWAGTRAIVQAFEDRATLRTQLEAANGMAERARQSAAKAVDDARRERELREGIQNQFNGDQARITEELTRGLQRLNDWRRTAPPDVLRCLDLVVPDDVFMQPGAPGPDAGGARDPRAAAGAVPRRGG